MATDRRPKRKLVACDTIDLLSIDEAAEAVGISVPRFLLLVKKGYISGIKSFGNVYVLSKNFEIHLPEDNRLGLTSKLVARTKFIQPEPNNAA